MRFRDEQYKLQQEVRRRGSVPRAGACPQQRKWNISTNASKVRRPVLLGQLLIKIGAVKQEHLEAALEQQKQTKKKIGTLLVENGWISESTLVQALQLYQFLRSQGDKLREKFAPLLSNQSLSEQELEAAIIDSQIMQRSVETILVEKYHISKQDIGQALSTFYRCPFVENLDRLPMTPDLVQRLNPTYLKANLWIPLQESKDNVTVLIDDPQDFLGFQDIRRLFPGKEIRFSVALRQDIAQYVQAITNTGQQHVTLEPIPAILRQLDSEGYDVSEEDTPSVLINENDSAIVRLANQIISDGYRKGASDIHIEPAGRERGNQCPLSYRWDFSRLPQSFATLPPCPCFTVEDHGATRYRGTAEATGRKDSLSFVRSRNRGPCGNSSYGRHGKRRYSCCAFLIPHDRSHLITSTWPSSPCSVLPMYYKSLTD